MKKVTAEIIEKCRLFVAVKVRDDATNEDIEKAINVAYLDDDCEVLEQRLHEITNIKVEEKMIDYEKLLDALQTIQNECAKYKCCTDCPFFVQSKDINCGILSRNPVNWKLNKVHVIRLINQ